MKNCTVKKLDNITQLLVHIEQHYNIDTLVLKKKLNVFSVSLFSHNDSCVLCSYFELGFINNFTCKKINNSLYSYKFDFITKNNLI